MRIITLAVEILIIVAVFSVIWWGLMRMSVPEPFKTLLIVIFALLGLALLWHLFVDGSAALSFR